MNDLKSRGSKRFSVLIDLARRADIRRFFRRHGTNSIDEA